MVASAQQPKAMRRIGVLTGGFGPDSQTRLEAFLKALAQLGWTEGQNVRLEIRRGGGDADAIRKHAAELAALAPDVIMAIGEPEEALSAYPPFHIYIESYHKSSI